MKALFLAVAILTAIVVFVGWSNWYVEEICTGLRDLLEAMPGGEEKDLLSFGGTYRAAENFWFSRKGLMQIIIGKNRTEEVCRRMTEMGMRYIGDDMSGYKVDRESLKLYLAQLCEEEDLSWKGIL